ncbi:MAG: DUF11 domain-containing protein [Dehalococcoidia bacterium]|nr:DUF11 domain-containing protein [Dehalococcoidia bacterium]
MTDVSGEAPYATDCAEGSPGSNNIACVNDAEHPAGVSTDIMIEATVVGPEPGEQENQASATVGSQDTGSNDTAIFTIAPSNIAISKAAEPTTANQDETVTYTLTVTNDEDGVTSPAPQDTVTITDQMPDGVDFDSFDTAGAADYTCSYDSTDHEITCENSAGDHAVDDTQLISYDVIVNGTDAGDQTNSVTATVASQDVEPAGSSATFDAFLLDIGEGLFHLDPWGDPQLDGDGNIIRDDPNNVRGYQHTVCLADPEGELADGEFTGIIPPASATGDETDLYWRIQGGGDTHVQNQNQTTIFFEPDGSMSSAESATATEVPCVTWYSSGAGEQNVTVVDGTGQVVASFGEVSYEGLIGGTPLVKEWNSLDPTAITGAAGDVDPGNDGLLDLGSSAADFLAANNLDGTTQGHAAVYNPATEQYEGGPMSYFEHVFGCYANGVPGPTELLWVDGAKVTFTISGSCGQVMIEGDDTVDRSRPDSRRRRHRVRHGHLGRRADRDDVRDQRLHHGRRHDHRHHGRVPDHDGLRPAARAGCRDHHGRLAPADGREQGHLPRLGRPARHARPQLVDQRLDRVRLHDRLPATTAREPTPST